MKKTRFTEEQMVKILREADAAPVADVAKNGFVERMNRTLLDKCFRVAGRTTWYTTVDEIQRDLGRFLRYYNLERSHQAYRLKGRTPVQALREALGVSEIPAIVPAKEVSEPLPTAA